MDKAGFFMTTSFAIVLGGVAYFSGTSVSTAAEVDANKLFMTHCKTCHGVDGKPTDLGQGLEAPDFTDATWQENITDEGIIEQVNNGTPEKMMPFKEKLNPDEIKALVPVVRGFGKK